MGPHWNWDFEDQQRAARARASSPEPDSGLELEPADPPSAPPEAQPPRQPPIRRRRILAAIVLALGALAILAALLVSHHRDSASSANRAVAPHARRPPPPTDAQADDKKAVKSVLAYTPFVKEGTGRAREVALTFDDGPGPYTLGVLSVLERFHAHATFFVIGKMLRYFGAATRRAIEDGDAIGNHTQSHPEMAKLSAHDQYEELFEQIVRVELLGGQRPDMFRPPYGSFDATTMRELHHLQLLMVLWSVDTDDYLQPGVATIVRRALAGARPGAIILLHDAGGVRTQTIAALPKIIRGLRARGLRLVTVPQLLAADPPTPGQPLPPNLSGD
ncbi:MAG TPA: polysaccharide deacetylase family protein [Solirubrobacteraceae bacterium]|nr:polysaccharide deacetylase family protein [Solirubrobacteraceae bacterium]